VTTPAERLSAALSGRYRIERELGAGGMATVFLAEDLKHDRKVAIKVLKPELAAVLGAERFVVEIKTTASMSHPHILPLFDSGTVDGFLFYVMPYIEGETIRDKLNRESQFGVSEAVRIAREVADALDYAHRRGVIHRDIKPENILLHDGRAMVMDFGIALAVSAAAGGRMTETGLSLGTPHYMSPEQATAEKEITPRSDVYSLASVLYEMLAGEPPHTAGTAQAVIMKIIAETVAPVTKLRKSVPANVAAAVATALQKVPADRFESAKAFSDALANPSFTTSSVSGAFDGAAGARRTGLRERVAWTLVAALAAIAGYASLRPKESAPLGEIVQFDLALPATMSLQSRPGKAISISADGSTLLYSTLGPNGILYAKRRLNDVTPTLIPGTEGVSFAELSPDGQWMAFFTDSTLRKIRTSGGPATTLAVTAPGALSWGRNDTIVIGGVRGVPSRRSLASVSAGGGAVHEVVSPDTGKLPAWHLAPRIVDDAGIVLFTSFGRATEFSRIGIAPLNGGASTLLEPPVGGIALGVIEGQLVFSRLDGAIAAVPLDVTNRRIRGEPIVLVDDAAPGRASLADNGTLVYETGSGRLTLVMVDQKGSVRSLFTVPRPDVQPRWSPEGKRIVLAHGPGGGSDIWVYDVSVPNSPPTANRLATAAGVNHIKPEWSHDGKRIYFALTKPDSGDINSIWSQVADGSAQPEPFVNVPNRSVAEVSLSRDGRMAAFRVGSQTLATNMDIWYRSLVGDTALKPLLTSPAFSERGPVLSPDGKWLAYVSNESSRNEVYVRAFPGPDSKWPVSSRGADEPMWSRDGRRLFYREANKMMAASVTTNGGTFAITAREALFDDRFMRTTNHANYDVAPDGNGFLMVQRGDSASAVKIVINLGAEIRKRVKRP
jgi:Tol biopolymer transport system component